jgi:hypothetical protein
MDSIDLTAWGLGTAVSLFPLAGAIGKLRGWFPPGRRPWFVTISTIFSVVVLVLILVDFTSIRFVPIIITLPLAASFLGVYIAGHLTLKKRYTHLVGWQDAMVTVVLLALYAAAFTLITYSFNVAVRLRDHALIYGTARASDTGELLRGADVTINFLDDTSRRTTTNLLGYYAVILTDEEAKSVSGMAIEKKLGRGTTHASQWNRNEMTIDEWMTRTVEPLGGYQP